MFFAHLGLDAESRLGYSHSMGIHTKHLSTIGEENAQKLFQEQYGITVVNFSRVESGEIAESYILFLDDQTKCFLKILHQNKIDHLEDLLNSLKLTHTLKKSGINNISFPFSTKNGELISNLGEYYFILQNFIDGDNTDTTKSETDTKNIASTIAHYHSISSYGLTLKTEPLNTDYANLLLEHLVSIETSRDFWSQKLHEIITPHKKRIQADLQQLHNYAQEAKKTTTSEVITHGDLIANNTMKTKQGEIFIVDWDSARLAPAERDIWFFLTSKPQVFIDAYKKVKPQSNFNINLIGFYIYKRYIEDAVYWINEIRGNKVNDEQRNSDFELLQNNYIEEFSHSQDIMAKIDIVTK